MTSSTELFQTMASSTGEMVENAMPFLYIFLGLAIAVGIGIIITRSLLYFFKKKL